MAFYKNFEVSDKLYDVIRHMRHVENYREDMQQKQVSWDYLSVLAQLASLDPELTSARKEFSQLTGVLLNRLGMETLNKSIGEHAFKAQVAVNIMVRNLFERTADIGFLTTDIDVREYLGAVANRLDSDSLDTMHTKLHQRFKAYVAKYSVYHNIILLDTQGKVLLQLDETNSVTHSKDALIAESISTEDAYVETYRHSDLLPAHDNSLIYSYKVASTDGEETLGVLCLCFRFENECAGIFDDLMDDDQEILTLLDTEGRVIASSNTDKVALTAKFKLDLDRDYSVVHHKGREYFCCTRSADAYEGYTGAGWFGHVMTPLDKLFISSDEEAAQTFSPALMESAMKSDLFDAETKSIPLRANQIQSVLNRSVWNGNVFQASENNGPDAAVSKVLLGEIKNTGLETKKVFESSITEIQKTVIGASLKESQSHAALAIDIMDRNLYERANDCRWWALDTTFRMLLAKETLNAEEANRIQSILKYINSLYTVYSNLLVFDKQGKVIAVSNEKYQSLVGTLIQEPWVKATSSMSSPQQYAVSGFEATALYDNKPSYVYSAAISSVEGNQVVGGVGIVFDSEPQFSAILEDILPKNQAGGVRANCFSVFTDKQKKVISSSSADFKAGDIFDIDAAFFALQAGESSSKITTFKQRHYAVGCSKSSGYREYKSETDAYQQEVFAFVLLDIGQELAVQEARVVHQEQSQTMVSDKGRVQLATFYMGENWLGLKAEQAESAIEVKEIVPIRAGEPSMIAGYIMYKEDSLALLHTSMLMGATELPTGEITEAVVVKIGDKFVGLTIDALGEMSDVAPDRIQPVGQDIAVTSKVVREVVISNEDEPEREMLQIIDMDLIAASLQAFSEASAIAA